MTVFALAISVLVAIRLREHLPGHVDLDVGLRDGVHILAAKAVGPAVLVAAAFWLAWFAAGSVVLPERMVCVRP